MGKKEDSLEKKREKFIEKQRANESWVPPDTIKDGIFVCSKQKSGFFGPFKVANGYIFCKTDKEKQTILKSSFYKNGIIYPFVETNVEETAAIKEEIRKNLKPNPFDKFFTKDELIQLDEAFSEEDWNNVKTNIFEMLEFKISGDEARSNQSAGKEKVSEKMVLPPMNELKSEDIAETLDKKFGIKVSAKAPKYLLYKKLKDAYGIKD
jgi:hypothetical protein